MASLPLDTLSPARSTDDIVTFIGIGAVVKGELHADGAVRVCGRVEGHVRCGGSLVVDDRGGVYADVHVASATIAGEVVGDVVASGLVELLGGGRVAGDIRAARVVLADGATLRGTVTLRAPHAEAVDTPASSVAAPEPAYLTARGTAPPARGLVERTVKPRLFLRRAVDHGGARGSRPPEPAGSADLQTPPRPRG